MMFLGLIRIQVVGLVHDQAVDGPMDPIWCICTRTTKNCFTQGGLGQIWPAKHDFPFVHLPGPSGEAEQNSDPRRLTWIQIQIPTHLLFSISLSVGQHLQGAYRFAGTFSERFLS
jgi:hypothetical protein